MKTKEQTKEPGISRTQGVRRPATRVKASENEHDRHDDELQSQWRRLLSILDGVPAFIYLQAPDHSIRFANRYFREHIGEPEGKCCYEVFWGRSKPCESCPPFQVFHTDIPQEWEWTYQRTGRTYQLYDYPFIDIDGSQLVVELGIDITERKHLENEILEIGGRERHRIGQDMHDGLGQALAGIAYMSKGHERKLAEKLLPEASEAAEITKFVNQALVQTHKLARGLCPVQPEEHGLASALTELASSVERAFGVSCHLKCSRSIPFHSNIVDTHLYYIVREAVNNAIRHGKAKNILISLKSVNGRIVLTVKDDGSGFPKRPKKKGMGLSIMKYRASTIKASLNIQRGVSGGTIVTCLLPNVNNIKDRSGVSHGTG